MSYLKIASIVAAVGCLFVAGANVAPTAEAHCGEHQNTCSDYNETIFQGYHCEGTQTYHDYNVYVGYCYFPAPGFSGRQAPCAEGQCTWGSGHGCLVDQYSLPLSWGYDCE